MKRNLAVVIRVIQDYCKYKGLLPALTNLLIILYNLTNFQNKKEE